MRDFGGNVVFISFDALVGVLQTLSFKRWFTNEKGESAKWDQTTKLRIKVTIATLLIIITLRSLFH